MKTRIRTIVVLGLPLLSCSLLGARAQAALSPSAYRVGALCAPPAPGYAGCLGLRLVAKRPRSLPGSRRSRSAAGPIRPALEQIEFEEPWAGSLSPQNVLLAYGLSGLPAPATRQTLAIVDAFDDPTAEHDLKVFDEQYGLPPCTTANGCFTKVKLHSPPVNAGWAQEIATDIEVAHGVCQSCKILLVEARSNSNSDLEEAEERAVALGATEISNSWGGPERGVTVPEDETDAFKHPGTVITAAAGDNGYLDWGLEEASERGFADYPASSPHVVAVGGTHLGLTAGGQWLEETVWNGDGAGGGGCSTVLAAPPWQRSTADWASVGCGSHRAVTDVSADADPYTGVAVYDSTPITEGELEYRGWVPIGGTSVASPIIAATFALAGGAGTGAGGQPVAYPARTLYQNLAAHPQALHDVTSGSNGACANGFDGQTGASKCSTAEEKASCSSALICLAGAGYDGPTGVGTPNGIVAFSPSGSATEEEPGERESEKSSKGGAGSGEGSGGGTAGSQPVPTVPTGAPSTVGLVPAGLPHSSRGSATVPILSAPALTRAATAALNRLAPRVSRVAFVFTLNTAARVKITLAKQVKSHRIGRWQILPVSLTLAGVKGRDRGRLNALGTLTPGRYRLTLAPALGAARSLVFRIR